MIVCLERGSSKCDKKETNAEGMNLIVIEAKLKKGKACIKAIT